MWMIMICDKCGEEIVDLDKPCENCEKKKKSLLEGEE